MYITKFVRRDAQPDEEYYYHRLEDAEYHYSLFLDDSSELYERIELLEILDLDKEILKANVFVS